MDRKWSVLIPRQLDPSKIEAPNSAARRLTAETHRIDPRPGHFFAVLATFVIIMVLHRKHGSGPKRFGEGMPISRDDPSQVDEEELGSLL
jgi:hypothetical protein